MLDFDYNIIDIINVNYFEKRYTQRLKINIYIYILAQNFDIKKKQ